MWLLCCTFILCLFFGYKNFAQHQFHINSLDDISFMLQEKNLVVLVEPDKPPAVVGKCLYKYDSDPSMSQFLDTRTGNVVYFHELLSSVDTESTPSGSVLTLYSWKIPSDPFLLPFGLYV